MIQRQFKASSNPPSRAEISRSKIFVKALLTRSPTLEADGDQATTDYLVCCMKSPESIPLDGEVEDDRYPEALPGDPQPGARFRLLKTCLDSVARLASFAREVSGSFVVDNGHRHDPAVKSLCSSPGYGILTIYSSTIKTGISEARNRGAGLATTEYIGFIDDDAICPHPG